MKSYQILLIFHKNFISVVALVYLLVADILLRSYLWQKMRIVFEEILGRPRKLISVALCRRRMRREKTLI